jgi:hypothetical protein
MEVLAIEREARRLGADGERGRLIALAEEMITFPECHPAAQRALREWIRRAKDLAARP